jgi:hypothetical protein
MKSTYAFHNRKTGRIELYDDWHYLIDTVDTTVLIPDTVEVKTGVDPTETEERPYAALSQDTQDEILREELESYCNGKDLKLVELNHE